MRLHSLQPRQARAGLTLVEMMIALALSIFIMAILSEAFVKGLEVFGQYKALADLEQRLRTVANIIRRDLRAPHFENSKRLSECTVSNRPMPVLDGLRNGVYNQNEATALHQQLAQYRLKSPAQGFFSIEEWANRPAPPGGNPRRTSFFEGQDRNDRTSYRDQYDVLHFTSRLEGNEPDKFFYGRVRNGSPLDGVGRLGGQTRYDFPGNNMYTSQAAEILYFPGNDDTAFLPGVGQPGGPILTFNLYRQAWLLIPDQFSNGDQPLFDPVIARFFEDNDISAWQDVAVNNTPGMFFNSMADVQHRVRRRGAGTVRAPKSITGLGLEGSDIMLTNVISFDVKVFDPFAYKIPIGAAFNTGPGGPVSGRGAYVDIGDVYDNIPGTTTPGYATFPPTAATAANDSLTAAFGGPLNPGAAPLDTFDTGTSRVEGVPGAGANLGVQLPTHNYPITSIQITIRVYEPKSRQTRQITIIQDM